MNSPVNRFRTSVRVTAGAVLAGTLLILSAGVSEAAPSQSTSHQVVGAPVDSTW